MENPIKIDDLGVPLVLETPLLFYFSRELLHQQFQGTIIFMVGLTYRE